MAGIGFVLRKLSLQDNLFGLTQAYLHSAVASSGPWLFTVLALGVITVSGSHYTSLEEIYLFRLVTIYNFCFSLVMSAPVFMVVTRYLADAIYAKDVSCAPGLLFGGAILLYGTQLPIAASFYFFVAELPPLLTVSAIINFMLVTSIWLISVFLSALKNYKAITVAFLAGLLLSVLASIQLAGTFGASGVLNGFSIGLAFILASLTASVLAEYPYPTKNLFAFMGYFRKYWEIALGGFVFNVGAWIDKWIMWFSPEAEHTSSNLVIYPHYDSATFLAYLTIVPAMALFVFNVETAFYERYLRFYRDIDEKAALDRIDQNHRSILRVFLASARNILVLQASITFVVILLAPHIFDMLNMNYVQLGMFRYGVLGALFHVMTIFLVILLSYFDNRIDALKVQFTFMIANGLFTWIAMRFGFDYYGYGYYLAGLVSFLTGAVIFAIYVNRLPYHTFITRNTAIVKLRA